MHRPSPIFLSCAAFSVNLLLCCAVSAAPNAAPATKTTALSAPILGGKTIDVSKPYGSHLQPILDKVKANGDQKTKISQIVESFKSRIQPLRDEYKQKRQDFLTAMTSGGTAENIMTKQVELSHLSSEISSRYCLMRLEIRRQLTPQQILLFEDYARQNGWNHH